MTLPLASRDTDCLTCVLCNSRDGIDEAGGVEKTKAGVAVLGPLTLVRLKPFLTYIHFCASPALPSLFSISVHNCKPGRISIYR